ncbi:hypothetical protein ABZX98_15130 [Streptomyces sp. NPDC002992]|uniref:hypothetical protein n=1 Tax=Streptomyces sp. NPDC002992 TaxID=3154273 RepID=UPI0033A27149
MLRGIPWIGIGRLFRGITQTVAAASGPAMPARGRQLFLGVVNAARPGSSTYALHFAGP